MDDFIHEYKRCLKKRNEVFSYNQKIKKRVRTTHTLFALFFLCVVYFYWKPQYVQGVYGTILEQQVQAEYAHLVESGWTNIREIQSYLQEYREKKRESYVILGNRVYRIREIRQGILQSKWGILVKPVFNAGTLASTFAKRTYTSVVSLYILLKDSGNGIIRIQQLGDVAASGIWIFFMHLLYWTFLSFRKTCNTIRDDQRETQKESPNSVSWQNGWVLIRDEENTHVVLFYDMVDIINHPLERVEPPVVYAWIYRQMGIE